MMSRRSGAPDTGRMASALKMPGIDPRTWITYAIITKISVTNDGPICDVLLMPDEIPETAHLATPYAGQGYGLHLPLEVDDWVVVEIPHGDTGHGPVITARVWDRSARPPQAVIDHPEDVVLSVRSGRDLHLLTSGGGSVEVQGAEVLLGGAAGHQPTFKGTTYSNARDQLIAAQQLWLAALLVYIVIPTPSAPQTTTYTTAQAAYVTALNAFTAASASYLTTNTKAT